MCATVAIGTQIETSIHRTTVLEIEPKSLPNVRHRGHRFPNRIETRFPNRPPMCATVAIGTQIASRCAPPWPSKRRPKPESIRRSCWKWNRDRLPMCATVAIDFQTEVKIAPENIMRRAFRRSRFEPDFGAKINQKSTKIDQNRSKIELLDHLGSTWVASGPILAS